MANWHLFVNIIESVDSIQVCRDSMDMQIKKSLKIYQPYIAMYHSSFMTNKTCRGMVKHCENTKLESSEQPVFFFLQTG